MSLHSKKTNHTMASNYVDAEDRGSPSKTDEQSHRPVNNEKFERGSTSRLRTLTEAGLEEYQKRKCDFNEKLDLYRRDICKILDEKEETDPEEIVMKKYELKTVFSSYQKEHKKYTEFLTKTRTKESTKQMCMDEEIFQRVKRDVLQKLEIMTHTLKQLNIENGTDYQSRHASSTTSSSRLSRQRAKAEAAKARMTFERKQLDLKKEQARLLEEQLRSKAAIDRKRQELDAEIEYLEKEKDAVAAAAEYTALVQEHSTSHSLVGEVVDKNEQTRQYISNHSGIFEKLQQQPPMEKYNNNTSYYQHDGFDMTKYLFKKDLILKKMTIFDDQPESYYVCKTMFLNATAELNLSSSEIFDLLINYLGPVSRKWALSLRSANLNDPAKGIEKLWMRLYERFGSPEIIESVLKKKLYKFPSLTNRGNKKLYDLSDLLEQISSLVEDPLYSVSLSYFNSSTGVMPIIQKLPYHLQNKWVMHATKYKKDYKLPFPPFTEFCKFVHESATMLNDPGLAISGDMKDRTQNARTQRQISVRKTDVKDSEPKSMKMNCIIHNEKHSLNQCRAFRKKTLTERKSLLRERKVCYICCDSDTYTKSAMLLSSVTYVLVRDIHQPYI